MIKATIQRSPYVTEMTFPCSETQLSKWLDELRMNPEHLCPAAMVVQIEPMELSVLEECEVSLDALNYLAKRMDGMDARELNQFFAVLTCDELEIGWGLKNIINLTFNLERFTLIEDTSNLENVGMTHMFNIRGCISSSELENKEWLVDEGRKMLDSGKGIQTEYGLLFVNEDIEFSEVFNGTTFPGYYCDPDSTAAVEISYCNLTELVELPCEDITIKKALCGLGVGSIKDCKLDVDYTQNFSGEWREKISAVKHTKDIFGLNNMLKTEEIRMEQTESVFMNEVKRSLLNNGYDVAKNGDFLMVSLNGRTAAFVNDIRMINNSNDNSDDEYLKIKGVVRSVNEYCNAYEKSPLLKAEGLTGDYHCLSEFNGTVLAAKSTEYGFEFVTWERTFDNKGVTQGNYYSDYSAAKEGFATRSGLIDKNKVFDVEELGSIRKCVNFTARHNGDLNFDDCEKLKTLSEKISESLPEQQQNDAPEMFM